MIESEKVARNDQCNLLIKQTLELARQLIILADEGEEHSTDDGCRVLYGIVRDCAYKIRTEAERERASHQAKGRWLLHGKRASMKSDILLDKP